MHLVEGIPYVSGMKANWLLADDRGKELVLLIRKPQKKPCQDGVIQMISISGFKGSKEKMPVHTEYYSGDYLDRSDREQ